MIHSEGQSPLSVSLNTARRVRRVDLLLLANVGNGLVPAIVAARLRRAYRQLALIAHRTAKRPFMLALAGARVAVLPVNRAIAAEFTRAGHNILKTPYGVVRPEPFYPAPHDRGTQNGVINFCVLGKLDRCWKGADTAVAAFRQLPVEIRSRSRLHLLGYAQPPRYGDGIVAYPLAAAEKVGEFLRGMDVMLVPSRDEQGKMRETFSQVAVQGMLSGLPLIASDLPVFHERLEHGGGLIFRTVTDLSAAMAKLATDPQLRQTLGLQARASALANFVWNTRAFLAELEGLDAGHKPVR